MNVVLYNSFNATNNRKHKMTNAQMIENYATQLIKRVAFRMESFGDTYAKAKSMVMLESTAGEKCWAIVDAKFSA